MGKTSGLGGKGNPPKRSDNILSCVKSREPGLAVAVIGLLSLLVFYIK